MIEVFVHLHSTKITLKSYEEYANQISSFIIQPTKSLNISIVSSYVLISSGAYYVPNDIIVNEAAELELQPGVILYFARGKGIISYGKLTIVGSQENLILITGHKWANISFIGKKSQDSIIINAIIEGGQSRRMFPIYGNTFRS